ncbi:MAG TPA: 3-dehydroquinate synthase [Acidimicrobiia bacterium]|nr:3-dehydroquinate synthase [Acidimicrobiia bacterium]
MTTLRGTDPDPRAITVDLGARSYDIIVGPGVLDRVATALPGRARVAIVSQEAIASRFAEPMLGALGRGGIVGEVFLIGDGEEAKSLPTVESLCRRFAAWGLLRGDAVVALGGGVVGDTAGFTAASYHRGVACLQAPTTLLAQVDAAIGGKTGVNLPEGKNLVGAFHQPVAVLADVDTLATLPDREYRAGLGEVAKYAFMGDAALSALLADETAGAALLARDPAVLTEVVARSAAIKAAVVSADEHERTGLRATLNYGHTLAHALETAGRYGLLHGEAVAVGLVFAAELAAGLDRLPPGAPDATRAMLTRFGLPTAAPDGLAAADLMALMRRDKKASGGLTFVLPAPGGGPLERVDDPPSAVLERAFAGVGVAV